MTHFAPSGLGMRTLLHLCKSAPDQIPDDLPTKMGYRWGPSPLLKVKDKDQSAFQSLLIRVSTPWIRIPVVATIFGMAALAIVQGGLVLPIPGTGVVTDPREIFTTVGAGLTGPIGGVIIGFLAGVREPGGIVLASILAHTAGGLWVGFSYKKLAYAHFEMPVRLLIWAAIILCYYYVFVITGFVLGQAFFYPASSTQYSSLIRDYATISVGAAPEALLTIVVTSLIFSALPSRHRRPLW